MKNQIEGTGAGEKFNAVRESRKWKEAVWRETAGMTSVERVAFFNDFAEQYFAERAEREREHARELVAR